ncbi:acyl-ACP desaturase [Nocardia sp. NPDC051463]|uniref:acyl-ACP desaturase n=1 Tax=Nocardia sp. NPDC051463 TaxID=3154845 RepID=UPI00344F7C13
MTETWLPSLTLTEVRNAVEPVVQRGADKLWSLRDLDWEEVRPDRLTDADRSVVRFITYIEDHLPGYMNWLLRTFPIDGADLSIPIVAVHREYFRFFVAWSYDEERHAAALTRYQEAAGINTAEALRLELAEEGRKHFDLPYPEPLEAFAYTMLQEKATQLFYLRFRDVVTEPVLRDLLLRMARDEARHFALYAHLVETYLRRDPAAAAPHLKHVLRTFRMPLSDTLPNYRRWSYSVAETAGYDHTEAYTALERMIRQFVDSPGDELGELLDLTRSLRTLP